MPYRIGTLAVMAIVLIGTIATAQNTGSATPAVHSGIYSDVNGNLFAVGPDGDTLNADDWKSPYTLERLRAMPTGTETGLEFDFQIPTLTGRLYYGFYNNPDDIKYSYPVFGRKAPRIDGGKATIDFKKNMVGKYDFVDWETTGIIRLGYRVVDSTGYILYDGKLNVSGTGPFIIDTSIVEGPFINMVTHNSAVVSFQTNFPIIANVTATTNQFGPRTVGDSVATTHHEIELSDLLPDAEYSYGISYGSYKDTYTFRTAPIPGTRKPFTFAYASDSRGNTGGGERNLKGVNSYIMKKIAVMCAVKDAKFIQFTGDLIDGYATEAGDIELEYANWKRTVEPFAAHIPFVAGIGNHENIMHYFRSDKSRIGIDKFPFETHSMEALFARNFVNPVNGPISEDGAVYDPDPEHVDFPPYCETAFYYTYDNVAMIVLNSNYWYSYSIESAPEYGGNLHGYIMDNQLQWFRETIEMFESDNNIDHIFVTLHTPLFPNGGHVGDDMWYSGNNRYRPTIAGKPVEKGIIERRDELLDLMMNGSSKVVATLTGDEHNYSLLRVTEDMPIYPDSYDGSKLTRFRPFWHINNGAAGAPYYGKENTPWMSHLEAFSTQNALVLFHVNGKSIRVEVLNPDTWELIDQFDI